MLVAGVSLFHSVMAKGKERRMTVDRKSTQYPCTTHAHSAVMLSERHCKKGENKEILERENLKKNKKKGVGVGGSAVSVPVLHSAEKR